MQMRNGTIPDRPYESRINNLFGACPAESRGEVCQAENENWVEDVRELTPWPVDRLGFGSRRSADPCVH